MQKVDVFNVTGHTSSAEYYAEPISFLTAGSHSATKHSVVFHA